MADDDEAIFNSALTDEAPEQPTPQEAPQPEVPETTDGPARDERGRFAPKAEQPEQQQPAPEPAPQPEAPPEQREAIPAWRLREEAEARRAEAAARQAAEARASELERMVAEFKKQQQPQNVPDIFDDPKAFVDHGVRSAIDPVQQEIAQLREFYSQRDAIREHGAEKVKAAYDALDQALRARDPEAAGVYQRAKQSLDPFGDIVRWHLKQTVFSQIGTDPTAWFEKQLEERLKDPAHQAKLMERIRGQVQQQPLQRPVTQLPPSLNKATASTPSDDDEDNSEGGLLKSALRR